MSVNFLHDLSACILTSLTFSLWETLRVIKLGNPSVEKIADMCSFVNDPKIRERLRDVNVGWQDTREINEVRSCQRSQLSDSRNGHWFRMELHPCCVIPPRTSDFDKSRSLNCEHKRQERSSSVSTKLLSACCGKPVRVTKNNMAFRRCGGRKVMRWRRLVLLVEIRRVIAIVLEQIQVSVGSFFMERGACVDERREVIVLCLSLDQREKQCCWLGKNLEKLNSFWFWN